MGGGGGGGSLPPTALPQAALFFRRPRSASQGGAAALSSCLTPHQHCPEGQGGGGGSQQPLSLRAQPPREASKRPWCKADGSLAAPCCPLLGSWLGLSAAPACSPDWPASDDATGSRRRAAKHLAAEPCKQATAGQRAPLSQPAAHPGPALSPSGAPPPPTAHHLLGISHMHWLVQHQESSGSFSDTSRPQN